MSDELDRPTPPQHQDRQPGIESRMDPRPIYEDLDYTGSGRLDGKVALITGADSGIGRAVAILFAKEGCDVAFVYLDEHSDAEETRERVEAHGQRCLMMASDVRDPDACAVAVERTVRELGRLDILVNNAAVQFPKQSVEEITPEQLDLTFRTNVFAYFYTVQAALKHLPEEARIINTTSVTAYRGQPQLIDYSATKGAILAMTRALAKPLAERKIRINAVAPGPIWTPLIPASFGEDKVEGFGEDTPLGRAGQPVEVAQCYLFLASEGGSYMTGQVLHPNGGEFIGA